jgi:hypothetical protein
MRHKGTAVARMDLNISNRGDDAGKRGRFGVDQVDASLLARLVSLVYRFFEALQLSLLLVIHMQVAQKLAGGIDKTASDCSCAITLETFELYRWLFDWLVREVV